MREFFQRKVNLKSKSNFIFLLFFITCFTFAINLPAQDTIPADTLKSTPEGLADTTQVAAGDSGLLEKSEDHSVVSNGHSHDEINRGERIFMGLLPFDIKYESCVSCHILKQTDTLNWNPSARDIALKYADKDFAAFKQVIMQPSGIKMEASHKDFNIDDENLKEVKAYLDNLAQTGQAHVKPSIDNLLIFLFLGLLLTWAIIELIFLRKLKWKFIPIIILLGAFSWQVQIISTDAMRLGRQQDYAPDQPVKFSHKVHAGDNGIDCKYCHTTVEHGKSAGIPATNLCMNCHIIIREGTNSGKFEIAKIVDAVEKKKPIEWVRIHNLPEHVFFSHAVHVGSGKLDCTQCHGQVQEMDIMKQQNDLSMGWCVNCHRDTKVQFAENPYYDQYIKLHEDLRTGKIDSITAEQIGANDCMKCHY
ncbi:MAG: cytochrome c3 family protein [Draconibacterium sp.]|nr:cytochrome c3 family protein [Draconibacterium sp.]